MKRSRTTNIRSIWAVFGRKLIVEESSWLRASVSFNSVSECGWPGAKWRNINTEASQKRKRKKEKTLKYLLVCNGGNRAITTNHGIAAGEKSATKIFWSIILITFLRHLCSFKLHFEIWFITHQTPNYMELLPFSCLCYPLLKPSTPYKLEPKPKLCILSSFSFIKSVYVCLDLILKKIYVFVEKLNLI